MRLGIALVPIFVFSVALVARADDLPAKLNFDRYKGILEHSPFAVATAMVAPAATPNFAKDLYVMSAAKSPDGDMVVIGSMTDKEFKKYLTTKNPVEGYGIASIDWSDKVGETKVTISKDGQYAALGFNQAEMSKPVPNRPNGAPPPGPAFQQQPPNFQRPVGLPTPSPHVRGVIQRNPQAPATPNSSAED
ncbi:MAG TPA: hypothetical protein VLK27_11385 [Chthoniobacterales bacterium]|nr:hypothetical protein [Chthoniobacterales bacterium]